MVHGEERAPTILESALQSELISTVVLLIALPVACWAWIVVMARDMYGPMTGASRWMMTSSWDAPHMLLLWAMWLVMMTGMMLPSAAPAILIYGSAGRRRQDFPSARSTYALAAGYITVWALFSLVATAVQRLLNEWLVMSPMMEPTSPVTGGVLLIVAGVYQVTPFKQACLRACQSPFGYLMRRWREGVGGAFRMGMEHGLYCLGCCWALMLLLFAGGVMNLAVIGSLTLFVILEKTGVLGRHGARISGAILVASGVWMLRG
jgi:predicted metal-binding membrane protein